MLISHSKLNISGMKRFFEQLKWKESWRLEWTKECRDVGTLGYIRPMGMAVQVDCVYEVYTDMIGCKDDVKMALSSGRTMVGAAHQCPKDRMDWRALINIKMPEY